MVVNNVLLGCYWGGAWDPRRRSLPVYCAGWQKGMVVVNNVLLGRYWPHVGPQEMLFICILRRVAEGDGGGEQFAAGPLLAACGTPRRCS